MNNPPGHIPGLHHPGTIVPINPPGHIPGFHQHGTLAPIPPPPPPETEADRQAREQASAKRRAGMSEVAKACIERLFANSAEVQQTRTESRWVKRPFWRGGGGRSETVRIPTGLVGVPIGNQRWETNNGSTSAETAIARDGRIFPLDQGVTGRNGAATRRIYGTQEAVLLSIAERLERLGVGLPEDQKSMLNQLSSSQAGRVGLINRLPT